MASIKLYNSIPGPAEEFPDRVIKLRGGGLYMAVGEEWVQLITGQDMADYTDQLNDIINNLTALVSGNATETTLQSVDIELLDQGTTLDAIETNTNKLGGFENAMFGGLIVQQPETVFQESFVIPNTLPRTVVNTAGGGTVTYLDQMISLNISTGIGDYAAWRTKKYLRYNSGRAGGVKFTALFDGSAVANSLQMAGIGTAEAAFIVGYDGSQMVCGRQTGGRLEIRGFQITTASTTNENVTVTLNGTGYSVAVTNSGVINTTAAELAAGTYAGWVVYAVGDTVFYYKAGTGTAAGAYSLSATTAAATITQLQAGAANTWEYFYKNPTGGQTGWNYGAESSLSFTLDPTKGNIYRIRYQYLGYGDIEYSVQSPSTGLWEVMHRIYYANTNTVPNTQDPAMQGIIACASLGSTTALTVKSSSFEGFVEGPTLIAGEPFAETNVQSAVSTTGAFFNVLTVRVDYTAGTSTVRKINRGQIRIRHVDVAMLGGAKSGEIVVLKNATLAGTNTYTEGQQDSIASICTELVAVSGGQKLDGGAINPGGSIDFAMWDAKHFLEGGDTITLAVSVNGGASPDFGGAISWKEDN